MQYSSKTGNKKFLPGNIIPHEWYKKFCGTDGAADFAAITVLADIVAWWRNGTNDYFGENVPKFDGRELSVPYDYFEYKFGLHHQRTRRVFVRLETACVLKRTVRNIELNDGTRINRIFIALNDEFIASCYYQSFDIRACDDNIIDYIPSDYHCRDHNSNKTNILKNRLSRLDISTKENFAFAATEKSESQSESNFYKNSFYLELRDFHPLSDTDCTLLQAASGREFSRAAMNEILLDMSKRLDRSFAHKQAFLDYMSKVLKHEMRDSVRISNDTFRIKGNMTNEDYKPKINQPEFPPLPDNAWGRIRQGLIDLLYQGQYIDRNWFSKLEASINEQTKEIELKAPSSFVCDWIKQNYEDLIEQACSSMNYKLSGIVMG